MSLPFLPIYDVFLDCLLIYSPVMKHNPPMQLDDFPSDLDVGAFLIAMFDDTRLKSQYTP